MTEEVNNGGTIQVRHHPNSRGGKYSIVVSRTYEEMSERVALCLGARLIETPSAVVGLSVGATPVGSYKHLSALAAKGTVDLSATHFLLLDEFFPSDAKNRRSGDEGKDDDGKSVFVNNKPNVKH